MRRVLLDNIKPGMFLSRPLMSMDGKVLLYEGIEVKQQYIDRLRNMGIAYVYVNDPQTADIVVEDVISPALRAQATQTAFHIISDFKVGQGIDMAPAQTIVRQLIKELSNNKDRLVNFIDIRQKSDYLFSHALNTCILSMLTGLHVGYTDDMLEELGLAALFHDIGKTVLPAELTRSNLLYLTPQQRSEYRRHTYYGNEILKKDQHLSPAIALVAYQHHERYNGSGYPQKLRGEEIPLITQIVSIADVYDRLTSGTPGRRPTPVYYVYTILKKASGIYFHPQLVDRFIENIAMFPTGTTVRLNTGEIGVIVDVDRKRKTAPLVRIIRDEGHGNLNELVDLDLSTNPDIFIIEFMDQ